MTLIQLVGFFVLTTLLFQQLTAGEEIVLSPDTDKDTELKAIEKRTNFRVPVETQFDPNFWPARGRRSGEDADKMENCDENFTYDKDGYQCQITPNIQEAGSKKFRPFDILEDVFAGREKYGGDCFGEQKSNREYLTKNLVYRLSSKKDGRRHKTQRHFALPQLLLYGNGVYWEPDNSFAEKQKKEDVFWVARGKKNFL